MDKFVKKKQRVKEKDDDKIKEQKPQMMQTTIHSLQGVVVMEDILHCKSKLCIPNQSKKIIVECLHTLSQKVPPKHVMLSTKIGHVVSKLRKHPDQDVVNEARRVYSKWRKHFESWMDKPKIEVKCDIKTENMRLRGKTYLADSLNVERSHPIVEAIEREAFHLNKRLNSTSYRRTMRTMVFKVKNDEGVRESLLNGHLCVEDFVQQHKKR